jgi:hypothetical protein
MAHVKRVEGRPYPHIFNVDLAVGVHKQTYTDPNSIEQVYSKSQPNKRDDVMLVQYLLKRIYQEGDRVIPPLKDYAAAANLKIDGMHGPKTQKAIESFQLELRRRGTNIATDGCVDSEKGEISSISKTQYSITWMNKYFGSLYPQVILNIDLDPTCPAELRQKLSTNGW